MKRTHRKLKLSRQTLRKLDLGRIGGGAAVSKYDAGGGGKGGDDEGQSKKSEDMVICPSYAGVLTCPGPDTTSD